MAQPFLRRRSSIRKEFNEKELEDLRTAFDLLDKNQDGRVTTSEFKIMLDNLGIDLKEDKIEEIIKTVSHSGKEIIDENDFLSFVKQVQHFCPMEDDSLSEDESNDLRAAFRVFDLDNNGFITRDELQKAMEVIGEEVTEEQLTQFITLADTDQDGRINYEEFMRLLS